MSGDDRERARAAWVDGQMAAQPPNVLRTMGATILSGIAAGTATAISTLLVSLIRWAIAAAPGLF